MVSEEQLLIAFGLVLAGLTYFIVQKGNLGEIKVIKAQKKQEKKEKSHGCKDGDSKEDFKDNMCRDLDRSGPRFNKASSGLLHIEAYKIFYKLVA